MNESGLGQVVIRRAFPDDAAVLSAIGKVTFTEAFGETNTKEDLKVYLSESFNVKTIAAQFDVGCIFHWLIHST